MSRGFAVVMGIMLASSVAAEAADRPPIESWGKPGIAFDQYRADSVECAKIGYFRDVSQDEPAKRFITGFTAADNNLNSGGGASDWINSILRTQPDRQKRRLHAIQLGDVERCLADKGYSRFRLSRSEVKTLARYPRGSEARQRYLHTLAAR
ncbi:hypothetical protein [uncultured Sphingomonas sp.]|uniref:hypothetical protein n=1 Tax=uncultured Sphingomonas sp. TaxID=158754 RepID=UPI0025E1989A|nr:hypothetical protein [uncultured Sphingomonas sp.]